MQSIELPGRTLSLVEPVVMGILNVTPDSFSDGGHYQSRDAALRQAERMLVEGAAIIDVGGESTRPGADPVSLQQELDRVVPVVEALATHFDCVISIDTFKPGVMDAACAAGAHLINDIQALEREGAAQVAVRYGAAVCLMHMQGQPQTMQHQPRYEQVIPDVMGYLAQRVAHAEQAGISRSRIVLDPGIGFGKSLQHNLELLGSVDALLSLKLPVLIGVSRKSMFKQLLDLPVDERLYASLTAASLSVWQGASIIRAHDVRPTVQALKTVAAIRQAREQAIR